MILAEWAVQWGVPHAAMADLYYRVLGLDEAPVAASTGGASEAAVQARVRLQASRLGFGLWRNNVGAGYTEEGSFMRWGLANDSKQLNQVIKSGDLIGCRPHIIQPGDVGRLIGRFVSYEVKAEGWRWRGDPHEIAQANWIARILTLGGDARFVTSESQL